LAGEADTTTLKLEIVDLKGKLQEAHQEADVLRSDLTAVTQSQTLALQEVSVLKSQIIDLQDTIDHISGDKESTNSQDGNYNEIKQLNETLNDEIKSLKNYIESGGQYSFANVDNSNSLEGNALEKIKAQLTKEQNLVIQLEQDLKMKESSLESLENELVILRTRKSTQEADLKAQLNTSDRAESMDREIMSVFGDNLLDLKEENLKLKADLDSSVRERRQLAGRIQAWQQELSKEATLESEEGLRVELRKAIQTLQVRDHKCEELTHENIRLLEERDGLMLKLSAVMRQLEGSRAPSRAASMAASRTTTPVPQAGGNFPNLQPTHFFSPHAEIRDLHAKLEELRQLNYSLDVELQKERNERLASGDRVMAPRSRHASQLLKDSPEKVQHI